jgi:hypothetical protein
LTIAWGTAKLLNELYTGADINWLRQLRNKYVHINFKLPALKIDDQYDNREVMEADARKAIKWFYMLSLKVRELN